ncbi:MAG: hypothetical protein K0S39_5917 [Paenibacillus sp.]|jgi:hypothetical protein|nr:hypothetical protein [Paenibacillus sp.]
MAVSAEAAKSVESVPLTPDEKVELLRQYESYCYQITYFLLKDCHLANKAAEQALLVLYKQDEWFRMPDSARLNKVKQTALLQALGLRKNALSS